MTLTDLATMQPLRRIYIRAAVVMVLAGPAFAAEPHAHGGVVYYSPAEFSDVPVWVVAALNARGCRIPQATYFKKERHNVIRGEFVAKGQIDWAALCSKNGKSSIVLLSTSKATCTQELAAADDSAYLQQVDANLHAFSRLINTATPSEIARYVVQKNPEFDHAGIVDEFAGKASTIFYCRDGKLMELPAGD